MLPKITHNKENSMLM